MHDNIASPPVYSYRSHGCVRGMPEHIKHFFKKVEINTPGELIYKPVKTAVSDQGRIFLEVHRDIYGKIKNLRNEVLQVIGQQVVSDKVNWEKAGTVIREKVCIAEDISL